MNGLTPWEGSPRGRSLTARPLGVPPFVIWLIVAIVLLLMSVPRLGAQDPLSAARALYASAAYDEALKTLQQLSASDDGLPPTSIREAEEYRFLCLLALNRSTEARESIGAVVTADPLYKLDEDNTSPRVVTAFRGVRRELLPDIVHSIYNVGKAAYDKKDFKSAEPQFRKVMALAADPDMEGRAADLQTLAKGFLDLAVAGLSGENGTAAPAGAAAPTNTAANATPASGAPTSSAPGGGANGTATAANGSAGTNTGAAPGGAGAPAAPAPIIATQARAGAITPPVTLKQAMPGLPTDLARFGALRAGELEVLIDETGKVQQARFVKGIHPVYDGLVLTASRNWRYEPAKADGVPVKFRKTIRVSIAESARDQQQQP